MSIRDWFVSLLRGETKNVMASPEGGHKVSEGQGEETLQEPEQGRHTLLIVDDEVDLLESLRFQFRSKYRVLTAGSGTQALSVLNEHEVHLILCDQRMPGMQGDAFLTQARRLQPDAIRMLFAGYANIQAVINAVNEGRIFRYILKPWDAEELEGIIRQAAEQYDLLAERKRLRTEVQVLKLQSGPVADQVREGQVIGNYQLQKKLGEGGMGVVFKAIHLPLSRTVAFKALAPERLRDPEAVTRFLREIRTVGSLQHANIVQGTDGGEIDGIHFLVMEFVDGVNLSELVLRRGPLSIADACKSISEAAIGLHHAHEHGLVHRDFKPSNVMLTRSGGIKVLDFGLARLYEQSASFTELTNSGQILGTIGYMAPEQAFAKYAVSSRTDIYSLGCTLYMLLTGQTPFSGPAYDTPFKILWAHAQEPVPPIQEYRPEVSPELATIIGRLLAKDPSDRFERADHLAPALAPFAVGADLSRVVASLELSTTVDGKSPSKG